MIITLENIKHFMAVVEHEGINKASEHIFISSSSLSRSIQIIETELNKKLFDRIGRVIHLNDEGKRFYEESKKLIKQYEILTVDVGAKKKELRGHYMIGASHFLAKSIAPQVIKELAKNNKHATFGIYSFDSGILIKKIHLGEIDMGFSFALKASSAIATFPLIKTKLLLCARKGHPLTKMSFAEVKKNLSHYPAIMHRPTDSIERCDNHPVFKQHKITFHVEMYWDSDFTAIEYLVGSDAWSFMPDFVIDSDPRIVRLAHPKEWNGDSEILLYWNKQKSLEDLKDAILEVMN